MAWGRQDQPRQPARNVVVEFDHINRTYRVELPATNSEKNPDDPLPVALSEFWGRVWKYTDMFTGQIIMCDLSNCGPVRIVPTRALQQPQQPQQTPGGYPSN
jgi:hypothetical protein